MLDVKDSPSICLCLSPASFAFCPSPALFRILLCIFHLLVVTLSNDSIYFRKQCPIYSELVGGKKTSALIILSVISIFSFFLLVIFKGGGSQLFDNALSYLPNTKLKWMLLIFSQLHETHLRKPLLLVLLLAFFFYSPSTLI